MKLKFLSLHRQVSKSQSISITLISMLISQTSSIDIDQYVNKGFKNKDPLFPESSIDKSQIESNFSMWWRILLLIYLLICIAILKFKYIYPLLEDLTALYLEKKKFFIRSFTYYYFMHIDNFFILLISVFFKST